jgi:hypothetical protein
MFDKMSDAVKLPFKVAERISKPFCDVVEGVMGEDVDEFVEKLPGGKVLTDTTTSFNNWLLEDNSEKDKKEKDKKKE